VFQMEDRLWVHLQRNEPTVQEITLEDYETSLGIRSKPKKAEAAEFVGSAVVKDKKIQNEPQVYAGQTKKEIIEILVDRGFKTGELTRKRKSELIELL